MTAVATRPKWFGQLTPDDVHDAKTFATYCQQTLGIPYPRQQDIRYLHKSLREFFEHYPQADYYTLCRIVEWAKAKKKRYAHVNKLVYAFRYAYADGFLPELDPNSEPVDEQLEELIEAALKEETDDEWRRRLMIARGVTARTEVYQAWKQHRIGL